MQQDQTVCGGRQRVFVGMVWQQAARYIDR
jgi:hypothetical protein